MLTAEEIEEAARLFREGFDTVEIAKALGVAEFEIYNGRNYLSAPYRALPGLRSPHRSVIA